MFVPVFVVQSLRAEQQVTVLQVMRVVVVFSICSVEEYGTYFPVLPEATFTLGYFVLIAIYCFFL